MHILHLYPPITITDSDYDLNNHILLQRCFIKTLLLLLTNRSSLERTDMFYPKPYFTLFSLFLLRIHHRVLKALISAG